VAVEQIGLSTDTIHAGFLIAADTERKQDAANKRGQRNRISLFEGHDTRIVDDGALWPEDGWDALVALVGVTGFANSTDRQLSRQLIGRAQLSINQFL